jgi:hypothetical protein
LLFHPQLTPTIPTLFRTITTPNYTSSSGASLPQEEKISLPTRPIRDAPVVRRADDSTESTERSSSQTAERRPRREGLPPAPMSAHASMPGGLPSQQPREAAADASRVAVTPRRATPPVCPTDDEAKVPRKAITDKRSFEYVWKSGVAGGFAGCAVGFTLFGAITPYQCC